MKLDSNLLNKLSETLRASASKYGKFVAILIVLTLFGFIFYRIGYFNNLEPSEDEITEKLLTVQRPRIDKDIVEKLENLEDQNIQVQTLFNQARENPFDE